MKKRTKPELFWIIKDSHRGDFKIHTISRNKSITIDKFVNGTSMTWKKTKSYGWEVVKINIIQLS